MKRALKRYLIMDVDNCNQFKYKKKYLERPVLTHIFIMHNMEALLRNLIYVDDNEMAI